MELRKVYDELYGMIEDLKKQINGGGSKDYDKLDNRPKVNNITLSGNKKSSDLKIAYSMTESEYAAATKNAESIYCLQENATTFEEEDETASASIEWSAGDPSGYVATWVYAPSNQDFTGCTAVNCDDATITIDDFRVVEGNVQVFLSCEDTAEIGEAVTFTFTLTQPAGNTRIVKNGVEFGVPRVDYSTTERKIGKWVDGSDLYEKTFIIEPSAASGSVVISSIDKLISRTATMTRMASNSKQQKDVEYRTETPANNTYGVVLEVRDNALYYDIAGYTYSEITEIRATIRYTKIA